MNYTVLTYGSYLLLTIAVTIWVGRTLFVHGKVFLIEIFKGDDELAKSVNKLLIVGFYLVNIGYLVFTMTLEGDITGYREVMEKLSRKVGVIILILGAMHFFNLLVLFKLKRKAHMEAIDTLPTRKFDPYADREQEQL